METIKNIWTSVTGMTRNNDVVAINKGEYSGWGFMFLGCL